MTVGKWARMALVVAALVAAAGCDPSPETDRVGMTVTKDGSLVARLVLCDDERVEAIRLLHPHGDIVNDEDDKVLWEVRASRPATTPDRIEVGTTPPEFRERAALGEQPAESAPLVLVVKTNQASAMVVDFQPRLLTPGKTYSQGRAVPDSKWEASACR